MKAKHNVNSYLLLISHNWCYDSMRDLEDEEDEEDYEIEDAEDDKISSKTLDLKEFVNSIEPGNIHPDHYRLRSPDRISIRELLSLCQKCDWQLPNFQRYFDWKKSDIRDLLDSVFRDFYIGALLLWEVQSEPQLKLIPILGTGPSDDMHARMIILDGQQRITSLYYAIMGTKLKTKTIKKPVYFYIDIERYLKGHEDNIIIMQDSKLSWDESLNSLKFPFYELKNHDKWVRDLADIVRDEKNYTKVSAMERVLAEKLKHLIDSFEIPYVVLPSSIELEQVADIFEKINTRGKILSVFDILIATLSKYNIDLRRLWDVVKTKYPRFEEYNRDDKMPIYILQLIALSYYDHNQCGKDDLLKIYDNVIKPKDLVFDKVWDEMAGWISKAIYKLENHNDGFGVSGKKALPYLPIIPILAALLRAVKTREDKSACYDKIGIWYWSSIFSKKYSSSSGSQLTADYRGMVGWTDESGSVVPGWFDNDSKVLKTVEDLRRVFPKTLDLRNTKLGAVFKGIMSLIALEGAQDFDTGQHSTNDRNDKHHIFPQQPFGEQFEHIDSILNMTWLSGHTNRKIINDKKPSIYMNEFLRKNHGNDREKFQRDILDRHLISKEAFDCMLNDDFNGFMKQREKTILQKIARVIGLPNDELSSVKPQ